MTDESKPPSNSVELAFWVLRKYGRRTLVLIALFVAAAYVYTNWDKVSKWPGVEPIAHRLTRHPIPVADPNRFSVMVAHLENDTNREQERLIVEALKEFEGIQVLALDRTVPLQGLVPEKAEKQGHESALRYLERSGASVLIWGTVLGQGANTIPKLYWSDSQGEKPKPKRYDAPRREEQLRLPDVFWFDLTDILRLLVASRDAEFTAATGHYTADRLPPFIARVRTLLAASADRPGWDANARASTRVILADALQALGNQKGESPPLREAVAAYREALKESTRERAPLDWAVTQSNLGNALSSLGERESGVERLEDAVAAYREALKELTRDRVPLNWAMTQNNLGIALGILGERESSPGRFEEAVVAFREALKEQTRDRVPLNWAMTQSNLGIALGALGECESGTSRLEEAVAAYREALEVLTRDRVPLDWAGTQNNLGNALGALGERESGTGRLEEAVAAYREALKERTRDQVPLQWAGPQNNLGTALEALGERESGTGRLEETVAAYKAALEVFEAAQVSYQAKKTRANLQRAETLLNERRQ